MREPLQPYRGANALNYLCLIATELLGDQSLRQIPQLAAGFESILGTLPAAAARALKNLRLGGYAPTTLRDLQLMVDTYERFHERRERDRRRAREKAAATRTPPRQEEDEDQSEQRFSIGPGLTITKRYGQLVPDDIAQALACLTSRLEPRQFSGRAAHEVTEEAAIRKKSGYEATVQPLGFAPPAIPRHDIARRGRLLGPIQWDDLVAIARRFDEMDAKAGRQQDWYGRLYDAAGAQKVILFTRSADGLKPTPLLDLNGTRHLIGLPGAGKTTLLYLLAAYLEQRAYRACFLFPSIEVSTAFLETLKRYEIEGALLFGQSETTRNRHVSNFASSLASQNKGLGATRSIAPFFSTNCVLESYASEEEEDFPHTDPPCQELEQTDDNGKRKLRQCALASCCGRQFAERELTQRPIWAGHVLSMDRRISPLFGELQVNHFEFLARSFDLIVVDECDATQSTLDERGTPLMKISGDDPSIWSRLLEDLHGRAARGRNAFVSRANMPSMLEMTGRFGRAAERLTARVMHFRKEFRERYERGLLTTVSIIADMFDDPETVPARDALERVWDLAAKNISFRATPMIVGNVDDDDDDSPNDLERTITEAAQLAGCELQVMRIFSNELTHALEGWDRDGSDEALLNLARVLRGAPGLKTKLDELSFFEHTALLTTVSLLVLQHFGLAPHLRLLNAQGLITDDVFEQRPSRDALALLPETLLGRLSGVRYTLNDEGDVDISHVGFVGTPRLLLERMRRLGLEEGEGPSILFTSATSMLEASPSFHLDVGPDYVLNRPQSGSGWVRSQYQCLPLRDPQDERRHLRFSGAKLSQRERVLKAMVDQLLQGGVMSEVELALKSNDVTDGTGRKAAFVVNSYEQCRLIYEHIHGFHPSFRGRVRYLIRGGSHDTPPEGAITAGEVESLGRDRGWDLLIFPMNAIGRGVNIVYKFGPRVDQAMVGSLFFLTRPHPRADSLLLMQGLIGRESERFDRKHFVSREEALTALSVARNEAARTVRRLLRLPLSAQRLESYARPFVADQMIMILQTIGRTMRGDCPAFVYFVDEAWAPNSAVGRADDERTSMLIMMRSILNECLEHQDPVKRDCYRNLYTSFATPLNNIRRLIAA